MHFIILYAKPGVGFIDWGTRRPVLDDGYRHFKENQIDLVLSCVPRLTKLN